jgi:hypothetical protein
MSNRHCWSADGQSSNIELPTRSVSKFGSFIDDLSVQTVSSSETATGRTRLIEGREDIISKLDLCDGRMAHGCKTYPETCDPLLGQGGVEDTFSSCIDT